MECDILDSLEQLGYSGPLSEEQALLAAAAEAWRSRDFVDLCRWIRDRLGQCLEDKPPPGPDDVDSLRAEMSAFLKASNCPYEDLASGILNGGELKARDHLKFILFLSSELQAAQIVRSGRTAEQRREESTACRELLSVCVALNVPEPRGLDAAGVFSQVQDRVAKLLEDLPGGSVGRPVLKTCPDRQQWERLGGINAALSSEYECRRRMLIKRLDVTVQSFGWSDRAKARVDSMARVYQPRRHALRAQSDVDASRLLAAREDICNVVKTSSGSSREKTVCAVNKILMGVVPDRGGRPSEIEPPPPEMPPWQKRQDGGGGGGWGGRGGGRGGGGGGGGRGGWRGGGWNQGGHGNYGGHGRHGGKRGRYQY